MPSYRRGFSRRRGAMSLNVIDSLKNVVNSTVTTTTTTQQLTLAIAKDTPVTTGTAEVKRGSIIKALWLSIDVCGLAATGVLQRTHFYLFKNAGANLTPPGAFTVGSSNEKRFVIKQWSYMTMRNQDGNNPNHWEGWIKIPRKYQRMATDDLWQLVIEVNAATGHMSLQCIYKWFS